MLKAVSRSSFQKRGSTTRSKPTEFSLEWFQIKELASVEGSWAASRVASLRGADSLMVLIAAKPIMGATVQYLNSVILRAFVEVGGSLPHLT